MVGAFISVGESILLLTPLAVVWLIYMQQRTAKNLAKDAEKTRVSTAKAAVEAAERVADTLLQKSILDKADLDAKLEVIRVDVNSNLTAALKEIEELQARLGITDEHPEGTDLGGEGDVLKRAF